MSKKDLMAIAGLEPIPGKPGAYRILPETMTEWRKSHYRRQEEENNREEEEAEKQKKEERDGFVCRTCDSTSFREVTKWNGIVGPGGKLTRVKCICDGCSAEFQDPLQWSSKKTTP